MHGNVETHSAKPRISILKEEALKCRNLSVRRDKESFENVRLNSGNVCYHSGEEYFFFWSLSEGCNNYNFPYFMNIHKGLCFLTEHHAMKAYWGSGGIALLIL
jgi:hypothetical protein